MSQLKYIFCHGLSGWGEYDSQYQKMPYWGMRNGDLLENSEQKVMNAMAPAFHRPAAPGTERVNSMRNWRVPGRITDVPTA